MTNQIKAADVLSCFELVEKTTSEVYALIETLNNQMQTHLSKGLKFKETNLKSSPNGIKPFYRFGDTSGVFSDAVYTYPLYLPRRNIAHSSISFQISMFGNGVPRYKDQDGSSISSSEPVLHIHIWHSSEHAEDQQIDFDRNFNEDGWAIKDIKDRRLIVFDEYPIDDLGPQLTYTIKLLRIRNKKDIDSLILEPVRALFNSYSVILDGGSIETLFNDRLDALVEYELGQDGSLNSL